MLPLILASALALASPTLVHQVRNYSQVICDDDPDPIQCDKIRFWYEQARSNQRLSCCGVADAYWADETKKVTNFGVFVIITDRRDCEYQQIKPQVEEDEDGNYTVPVPNGQSCITGRILRDGQTVFVPNDLIDHLIVTGADGKPQRQGNPTGHQIVFISAGSTSNYLDDGVMYPSVICAFPGFTG